MQKSLWILWLPTKLDPTPCPLVPPVADVHRRGELVWPSCTGDPPLPKTIQASSGARFPHPPLGGAAGPLIPPPTPTAVIPPRRSVRLRTVLCGPWGCSWSTGAPSCGLKGDAAMERVLAKSKLVQDTVGGVDSSCWSGRSQRPLFIHFPTSRSQWACFMH